MKNFLHFFQYHNAIPIALGVIVLGGGGVFAATNPEAIYSETQEVLSIDNSYLVGKDLAAYSPRAAILGVTEDDENYYVEYDFYTIDVAESVWRDVTRDEVMKVSKGDLGQYRDLGLYVTQQLKQVIERESSRLVKTQQNARNEETSSLVVATTYGGLIGALLDDTTEVLPGYTPVVTAPTTPTGLAVGPAEGSGSTSGGTATSQGGSASSRIGLQLLGNNPAKISIGTQYADLGAVLIDPFGTNVGIYMSVDGVDVVQWPGIDTSTTSVHVIEYRATDPQGNKVLVRRNVLVGDAQNPGGEVSESGNVRPVMQTPAPQPAPVNEPAPAQNVSSSTQEVMSDSEQVNEGNTTVVATSTSATTTVTDIPDGTSTTTDAIEL